MNIKSTNYNINEKYLAFFKAYNQEFTKPILFETDNGNFLIAKITNEEDSYLVIKINEEKVRYNATNYSNDKISQTILDKWSYFSYNKNNVTGLVREDSINHKIEQLNFVTPDWSEDNLIEFYQINSLTNDFALIRYNIGSSKFEMSTRYINSKNPDLIVFHNDRKLIFNDDKYGYEGPNYRKLYSNFNYDLNPIPFTKYYSLYELSQQLEAQQYSLNTPQELIDLYYHEFTEYNNTTAISEEYRKVLKK